MMSRLLVSILVVLIAWCGTAFASGNDAINTRPDSTTNSFQNNLDAYLGDANPPPSGCHGEDACRYSEMFDQFVATGGTHATAGTCTSPAFATVAYTTAGNRVNQPSLAINYNTAGCNCANPGTATGWVAVSGMAASASGNFHRVGTSKYFVNCTDVTRPTLPPDSAWVLAASIVNGVISSVDTSVAAVSPVKIPSPTAPYFDIRSYGGLADGVTDDLAAINKAITAAAVKGGTVYIPRATKVTGAIVLTGIEGVTLRCGEDQIGPTSKGVTLLSSNLADDIIRITGHANGTAVVGCSFAYTGTAQAGTGAVHIKDAADTVLSRLSFWPTPPQTVNTAIWIEATAAGGPNQTFRTHISDSIASGTLNDAILLQGFSGTQRVQEVTLRDVTVYTSLSCGLKIRDYVQGIYVHNFQTYQNICDVYLDGHFPGTDASPHNIFISDSILDSALGTSFYGRDSGAFVLLRNNWFSNAAGIGLQITRSVGNGADSWMVTGNHFTLNHTAIDATTDKSMFNNNRIHANPGDGSGTGIILRTGSAFNSVIGNWYGGQTTNYSDLSGNLTNSFGGDNILGALGATASTMVSFTHGLAVDGQYYLYLQAGNPILNFATSRFAQYDRAGDTLAFNMPHVGIVAGDLTVDNAIFGKSGVYPKFDSNPNFLLTDPGNAPTIYFDTPSSARLLYNKVTSKYELYGTNYGGAGKLCIAANVITVGGC